MSAILQRRLFETVTAGMTPSPDEAEMLVSTPTVDRQGDRVQAEGVQLDHFRRNPVLLWGHDTQALPIGTVTQLTVEPGQGLRARWRWLAGDAFADRVRNAWEQGIVRAASIGFLPRTTQPNDFGGQDYATWELMEISLVALPANAEATRQLKALGLDPDGPRTLKVEVIMRAVEARLRRLLNAPMNTVRPR